MTQPIWFTKASSAVIEALVRPRGSRVAGVGPATARSFLARASLGIAIRIAQAWTASTPLAHATEDNLVDAYVLGRWFTRTCTPAQVGGTAGGVRNDRD